MANRATVTYNGSDIFTEDKDGTFEVEYNGSTLANVGAGQSKTLNCKDKVMLSNVVVGGKTLLCKAMKMASDIVVAVKSLFPSSPSSYSLIGTYTTSQTWKAPENGYFQIEVFGASGNGGNGTTSGSSSSRRYMSGGGGGGGGYSCSRIKMNKGDTIALAVGAVGVTSSATISSSLESYSEISVTSGANGEEGWDRVAQGGAGGVASGGNYSNKSGGAGAAGKNATSTTDGGAGGAAGYTGGNVGGAGGKGTTQQGSPDPKKGKAGSAGFIKIYRGNTNLGNDIASLPSGYVLLNYIEATGTQYIDTGCAFTDDFRWEITFENVTASNTTIFGGRTSAARTALLYYGNASNNNGVAYICCPIAGMNGSATPFKLLTANPSEKHTVKMSVANNVASVWLNGVMKYDNVSFSGTYISGVTQAVFADNYGTDGIKEQTSAKVYGLKMWQEENLVRDFIPCINDLGEAGLYDLVNARFYGNNGSGTFITG